MGTGLSKGDDFAKPKGVVIDDEVVVEDGVNVEEFGFANNIWRRESFPVEDPLKVWVSPVSERELEDEEDVDVASPDGGVNAGSLSGPLDEEEDDRVPSFPSVPRTTVEPKNRDFG